ncbi:hypothetical protein [Bradyrhizobium sp. ARR65]|uniref:hypothetical protein n=1 Tax=Bradyrhizobium sp. ARR65 TaxID=1040989 RepID=UPI0012FA084B|nr:hypothetical protein [Bradyrhizobium sp. ARR65]
MKGSVCGFLMVRRRIALIEIDVKTIKSWSKPASLLTYAYYYVQAKLTGKSPSPERIAEEVLVHF